MIMKQAVLLGLASLIYLLVFAPIAFFGSELWTDILFGNIRNISGLAFYCAEH